MQRKMVDCTLDALSPMSDGKRKYHAELAQMPVDQIDRSGRSEPPPARLAGTQRAEHDRPIKHQINVGLDSGVPACLKVGGKGNKPSMNIILSQAALGVIGWRTGWAARSRISCPRNRSSRFVASVE